jgi:hypothetical protein
MGKIVVCPSSLVVVAEFAINPSINCVVVVYLPDEIDEV